jgi:hypothetical protein
VRDVFDRRPLVDPGKEVVAEINALGWFRSESKVDVVNRRSAQLFICSQSPHARLALPKF